MSELNAAIFREYDIRGIAETDLNDHAVEGIAAAAAVVFIRDQRRRIALGYDARPSSPRIVAAVKRTLVRYGLEVVDVGLVPTPVAYFAVAYHYLDGLMMITASHNPSEYNGCKIISGKSPIYGKQIRELYEIASAGTFAPEKPGRESSLEVIPGYLDYIEGNVHLHKPIKVVIDGGNGTAGLTAGTLYRRLGAKVTEIYCDVDGSFPNHHPDPTIPENLVDLIATVKREKADLGIAFDGDADRIGAVDGDGNILWGDQLLIIFARDILRNHPGAKIISEVKASEILYKEIAAAGGIPIMWKAGHSLIKQKIREENALAAGEVSGHIFFNDKWFGFDDAVYAGARLLEILSHQESSLADIRRALPQTFNTPEIRVDTTDTEKFIIVDQILAHFRKEYKVIDIDGARIQFPHGWGLVRASNTQPALVLRFEADSQPHLQEIRAIVEKEIARIRATIEQP